jgi:uroporphyrinogen-III synthase
MGTTELAGVSVLVTRPAKQAQRLVTLIEEAGGHAVRFPTIEITELPDSPALSAAIDALADVDMAVFVSTNAVECGVPRVRRRLGTFPPHLACVAIGEHTARRLRELEIPVRALAVGRASSESLLEHPLLADVAGKRIVLFRGEGGRELLADGMRGRGAEVVYAQCYRRDVPRLDSVTMGNRWQERGVDIATFTSVAAVENLGWMLGAQHRALLTGLPAVVLSARIAVVCRDHGMEPLIAPAIGDEAVVDAIRAWRRSTG